MAHFRHICHFVRFAIFVNFATVQWAPLLKPQLNFCLPFGDRLPDSPLLASFCHFDQIRIFIKIAILASASNVNIRLTNAILSNFSLQIRYFCQLHHFTKGTSESLT